MRFSLLSLMFAVCAARADVRDCVCDLGSSPVSEIRGCSLCVEAQKHPASEKIILLRDSDPAKSNRWLAMPRATYDGANPLVQMSAEERRLLWDAAIAKAKELWGDSWGIAMNGDIARRQCHAHVHIGRLLNDKLLDDKETDTGVYIDTPGQLPAVSDGTGLWFHPVGSRLHVHLGGQIMETVLMR